MSKEASGRRTFMKTAGLAAGAALAEALASREARADDDRRHGNRKDNDDFIRAVQRARIFDLSHTWDEDSPIAGVNPDYTMRLDATHQGTISDPQFDGKLSFTSEIQQFSGQHGAPSIDAIGHIGHKGLLFGRVNAFAATSDPRGIGRGPGAVGAHLDIAHYPTEMLVNRGVLLDVARFINGNADPLVGKSDVTDKILAAAAHRQGVKIRRGDTVLVRTGWGRYFTENAALYSGREAAGVGVSGARFLVKQGARVVGNDTLTFEVRPPVVGVGTPDFEVFPVHQLLIPGHGINIIENYFLDEIAAAEEYEFLLVVPPLKIRGGTGSALRSFALVP